jgi:hypothetical protein
MLTRFDAPIWSAGNYHRGEGVGWELVAHLGKLADVFMNQTM